MIINEDKLDLCKDEIKQLVRYLESVYGKIIVTSGYRGKEYNRKVGGAKHSAHITGEAVDLYVYDTSPIKIAAKALEMYLKFPVKGIGLDVYKGYVHLDIRDRGVNGVTTWVYGRSGRVA